MTIKPLFKIPTEIKKNDLEKALDQAIALEVATIPTYLNTYYSIKRTWKQEPAPPTKNNTIDSYQDAVNKDKKIANSKNGDPMQLTTGEGLTYYIKKKGKVSEKVANHLSIQLQVYANKAAALIMSVAVEEMLHTSLSSNVKQGLFGPPKLMKSIPGFPAHLPGHEPYVPINAAKFSQQQLLTFLRIESPEAFEGKQTNYKKGGEIENTTIGEFYRMIEICIKKHYKDKKHYRNDRAQLLPGKGYYGPNSLNTVYYDEDHNPEFPSDDDSGDLRHVKDWKSAIRALEEVVEQGEGHDGGDKLSPEGNPVCPNINWDDPTQINPNDYDNPSLSELSHFDKFLQLYCQGEQFTNTFEKLGMDFHSFFVYNFPDNPTNYPRKTKTPYINYAQSKMAGVKSSSASKSGIEHLINLSDATNAVYTYLFLMIETCYYKKDHTQYEIFMFGVHKGMIWALSGLCNAMLYQKIEYQGTIYSAAPTWEKYDFSKNSKLTPKQQILEIFDRMPEGSSGKGISGWVNDFPDITLRHKVLSVV
ncbi:MAG: ferritin-like domain-containing protein [Saprospiraceae bacterium]